MAAADPHLQHGGRTLSKPELQPGAHQSSSLASERQGDSRGYFSVVRMLVMKNLQSTETGLPVRVADKLIAICIGASPFSVRA